MTKAQAGRLGGKATALKHGHEYMRTIGKRGARRTWSLYHWLPIGIGGYALTRRDTGNVVATVGERPF